MEDLRSKTLNKQKDFKSFKFIQKKKSNEGGLLDGNEYLTNLAEEFGNKKSYEDFFGSSLRVPSSSD